MVDVPTFPLDTDGPDARMVVSQTPGYEDGEGAQMALVDGQLCVTLMHAGEELSTWISLEMLLEMVGAYNKSQES